MSSTNGPNSNVDSSKLLSDLDEDELRRLSDSYLEAVMAPDIWEALCVRQGIAAELIAEQRPDLVTDPPQCEAIRAECSDEPELEQLEEAFMPVVTDELSVAAACDLPVAALQGCIDGLVGALLSDFGGLSCDSDLPELSWTAGEDPDCQSIGTDCPDVFRPEDGTLF